MTEDLISEGRCLYCDEVFKQNSIVKHLAKHLADFERKLPPTNEQVYHLNIQAGEMFLQVLVKSTGTFKTLDTFLRNIWVECCGHLSGFRHKNFEVGMSKQFQMVLTPKLKFSYHYDYGSTTSFSLQVCKVYQLSQKENIVLLSRNEPLKIMCQVCNRKPAVALCSVHMYETDEYFYCDDCTEHHEKECEDFADYARMPVVNSPRMGTCGYEGGIIDVERDGVFK